MKQPSEISTDYRHRMGKRLRSLREKIGETQSQFAQRLGVIGLSVHKYETGVTCPTAEQLHNLELSGIDATYVAFGHPSLANAQARKDFSAAFSWVKRVGQISSHDVSDEHLIDVAWVIFSKFNNGQGQLPPTDKQLNDEAQVALSTFVAMKNAA